MITVADVLSFLNTIAPEEMKEDWDHVGLNCGRMNRPVEKILVALDPFAHVCQEALEVGADLLVTHHPLIWTSDFPTDQNEQGRNTIFLIENNIACISAHTNLDFAPCGVNNILAEKLCLKNIQIINPRGIDSTGHPWGLLRQGTTEISNLPGFLAFVKKQLGCHGLRYADGGKQVSKVAVGGGACASAYMEAVNAGCDTFVTADVKYNQFWDAQNCGLTIIDAGHFYTENPVCLYLAQQLQQAFPAVNVILSKQHDDCANFFQ